MFWKTLAKADSFNNSCSSLYLNYLIHLKHPIPCLLLTHTLICNYFGLFQSFIFHLHKSRVQNILALDILGSFPFCCCCMQLMVFGYGLCSTIVAQHSPLLPLPPPPPPFTFPTDSMIWIEGVYSVDVCICHSLMCTLNGMDGVAMFSCEYSSRRMPWMGMGMRKNPRNRSDRVN